MGVLFGQTTRLYDIPYLTVAEYKSAPTAIDFSNLVTDNPDPAVQDAELANVIMRGSSWIDIHCNQVLAATSETEQQRARLRPDGMIAIHPRYFPVVAVSAFSFGLYPNQMVDYPDPSQGWVEDETILLPYSAANIGYSSQGPLQFGLPAAPRQQVYCRYTYIAGFPNTLLAAGVNAGVSTITVTDASGITAGTRLTMYDGANTETVTVASTYTYGSLTVPLTAAVGFAHASGISVSALPPAVKQAAILATTAFIKVRGDTSLTMDVLSSPTQPTNRVPRDIASDLGLAAELLKPFRRIR